MTTQQPSIPIFQNNVARDAGHIAEAPIPGGEHLAVQHMNQVLRVCEAVGEGLLRLSERVVRGADQASAVGTKVLRSLRDFPLGPDAVQSEVSNGPREY